jgi:hypothetical protein
MRMPALLGRATTRRNTSTSRLLLISSSTRPRITPTPPAAMCSGPARLSSQVLPPATLCCGQCVASSCGQGSRVYAASQVCGAPCSVVLGARGRLIPGRQVYSWRPDLKQGAGVGSCLCLPPYFTCLPTPPLLPWEPAEESPGVCKPGVQVLGAAAASALDPGSTTCINLHMWLTQTVLPAVPGEKMGSRVAASLTAAMGCGDTIARNEDDYAEIAVAFGRCCLLCSSLLRACASEQEAVLRSFLGLCSQDHAGAQLFCSCATRSPLFCRNARALQRAKACVRKGKVDAPLFDTARWVLDQERALAMASGTCPPRQTPPPLPYRRPPASTPAL